MRGLALGNCRRWGRLAALGWVLAAAGLPPAPAVVADHSPSEKISVGRLRPAFDHLGNIGGQMEAAAASGCTVVYATGLGAYSYTGLPPRATLDAYLQQLREYNRKAHAGGVHTVLSYLCATSIVGIDRFATNWSEYFPGRPPEFTPQRMLQQDRQGKILPSWYGADYVPADMWNPYWREYTKLTLRLVVASGHDGVFFDNPTVHTQGNFSPYAMKAWASFLRRAGIAAVSDELEPLRELTQAQPDLWREFRVTEAADFIREMREYGRTLKPDFLLTVNNSLNSWDSFYSQPQSFGYSILAQSAQEDFVTIEDMSSQPRRQGDRYVSYGSTLRLIHSLDHGRPLSICTTDGDYIGPPNLMGLAIAECTAHDAAYMVWSCWEPAYRSGFAAGVNRYHAFLANHRERFDHSQAVPELLLLWPYENWVHESQCRTAELARELSAANLQYEVVVEADLTASRLRGVQTVVRCGAEALARPASRELLQAFERRGGRVISIGTAPQTSRTDKAAAASPAGRSAKWDLTNLIQALGTNAVTVESGAGVRAVVRRARSGEYLLHLYNLNVTRQDTYHDRVEPVENVRVSWRLPAGGQEPRMLQLFTPDESGTSGSVDAHWHKVENEIRVAFIIPRIWLWTIVSAEIKAP